MLATTTTAIPDHHFSALQQLETGYWWYVGRLDWASRLIREWMRGHSAPTRYADVGCGTGGFARATASAFGIPEVALVDSNMGALKRAPREGLTLVEADITREVPLPWRPELITLMDVAEHVEDDGALFGRLADTLAPGGLLVASVPAHRFLYTEWDRHLGHHRRYSRRELVSLAEKAGLRVRTVRYMWSFLVPAAPWRMLRPKAQKNLEFPKVSAFVNRALILASRVEWAIQRWCPMPFGTSLILSAVKP